MWRRLGLLLVAGLLALQSCAAAGPPTPVAAGRTDGQGDPLPPAALARVGTVRLHAGGRATHLTFSADGKVLFSLAGDHTLFAWDTATGKEVQPLKDLPENAVNIALSPNGRMLALTDTEGGVRVWDLLTGRVVFTYRSDKEEPEEKKAPAPAAAVPGMAAMLLPALAGRGGRFGMTAEIVFAAGDESFLTFTPDNKGLALGGDAIRLIDLATGKKQTLKGHPAVSYLAFSADGKRLASAGGDGSVVLWDRTTGKRLRKYEVRQGGDNEKEPIAILRVDFAPDNSSLLATAFDGSLHVLDLDSIEELKQVKFHDGGVLGAGVSPEGRLIALSCEDGSIKVRQLPLGKVVQTIQTEEQPAVCLAFAPGGKMLAVADDQGHIRLWEVSTGKEVVELGPRPPLEALGFSADGKNLIGVTARAITHYSAATGKPVRQFPLPANSTNLTTLSPGGKTLALVNEEETIKLIDTGTGKVLHDIKWEAKNGPPLINFSPDGKLLALMGAQTPGHVRLVNVATGKERPGLGNTDAPAALMALAFSPDARLVFSGHPKPGLLRRWELATGRERLPFKVPAELVQPDAARRMLSLKELGLGPGMDESMAMGADSLAGLVVSPDGKLLAVPRNGTVYLCSVATGKVLRRLVTGSEPNQSCLAFSPDSRLLATAAKDHVCLWDVATGVQTANLAGHRGNIRHLAFSPKGHTLVSTSDDCTALVWDVAEALRRKPDEQPSRGPVRKADDLWGDLASDDAARAENALRELIGRPTDALPLLKDHLRPASPASADRVAKLIAELDSDKFEVREQASRQLQGLGDLVSTALHEAAGKPASKERQKRIQHLLEKLDRPTLVGDQARLVRAIEVLEAIASPAARDFLTTLSRGAPDARLTRESRAALTRLRADAKGE